MLKTIDARGFSLGGGARIPDVGGDVVRRQPFAPFVEIGEIVHSRRVTFLGGEGNPMRRGVVVKRNSDALEVKKTEIRLRCGFTLIAAA